ncbi:unnamed protein product, partial [Effrenium voratum]
VSLCEEKAFLRTLKEIAKESQLCPQCSVRVQRSMGCNHMTCTQHFRAGGCTTFDTEEVQRMAMRQRQAVGFVDDELERLRAEFGDQGNLFAQFQADRQHRGGALPPAGRRNVAQRLRQGEVQCPVCGQFNGRAGGLNHIRCGMCRRRSPSAPTYHGGRQSASPDGPSKYAGAGLGQSPPVQASSARRSRSMPQGRSKHSEGRCSAAWTFPHSAQTKSGMPRRSVSGRRSSAGSPLPSSRGSASTLPGHRPGSRPSWGTAPAMPDAQDSKGRMGDLHGPKTGSGRSDGSLLGSIIEDVAQLSAQVERLLSRRKDLLRGEEMRRSDRSAEVLELSPSDSSTGPEGDRRAW